MFGKEYEIETHEGGKRGRNIYKLILIRKFFGLRLRYESIPLGLFETFSYTSTHKSVVELMIQKLKENDEYWIRMKLHEYNK